MNILVLQETDWLTRGPHIQHHIFERLSKKPNINITVIDYDIDKVQRAKSHFIKKQLYTKISKTVINSNVKIIRTACIQVPYIRRISSLLTNFLELLRIMRKNRPDIIIGYSITNGLIGLLLARLFKIPFVFHYIDILHKLVLVSYVQNLAKIVTRFLFKYSDKIIVLSKLHKNKVINEGSSPEKTIIVPNGISLENTVVDENKLLKLSKKFSINDNDFVIFFMGWLYDFAGLYEIIDYYNLDVKNGKFKLKFLILGDGGIYNNLINHVKKIGADWVILPGRVPFFDVPEYIQLADLCLLSFKINDITKEIIPSKILEYMAMKKPILSTALPGVVYEIGKNNGIIFTRNQEELIKRIGNLIPLIEELKKIGLKGFILVKEKYVWSKIIENFKKIIIDLLRKNKRQITHSTKVEKKEKSKKYH